MARNVTKLSPDVELFARDIEKARRDDLVDLRALGMDEKHLSSATLLSAIFTRGEILVNVVNDSQSRAEVILHAARIANVCRQIAMLERTDDKDDMREVE